MFTAKIKVMSLRSDIQIMNIFHVFQLHVWNIGVRINSYLILISFYQSHLFSSILIFDSRGLTKYKLYGCTKYIYMYFYIFIIFHHISLCKIIRPHLIICSFIFRYALYFQMACSAPLFGFTSLNRLNCKRTSTRLFFTVYSAYSRVRFVTFHKT